MTAECVSRKPERPEKVLGRFDIAHNDGHVIEALHHGESSRDQTTDAVTRGNDEFSMRRLASENSWAVLGLQAADGRVLHGRN